MTLDISTEVERLFRTKMIEFIEWSKEHWTITEKEAADDSSFGDKPEGYRDGYNAAIVGLQGAFECWNEEQLP